MKRIKIIFALLALFAMSVACHADGRIIPVDQLPAAAKAFIQQYFADRTPSYAEKEDGKYEVRFNDGTEVGFDRQGGWDKVDCKMAAVPAALVPEAVSGYVEASFPGSVIVKIDKERYGFEIELSNDLELRFNKNGKLLSIDD